MRLVSLALFLPALALAQPANIVGLNTHLPAEDELDAVADLGVSWIRIDNNWINVEPQQGRYRWAELDRVVDGARARGMEVFMTVAYAPAWATEPDGDGVPTNNVPRADTYPAYVRATVEHFRGRVTHYGIWNEPNLDHFFEGSLEQYVDRILRPGAAAVRAACPECRVLGPDLAGVSRWQSYLEGVMRAAGDAFDIVTHHTYASVPGIRPGLWGCDDFEHAMDIGEDAICFYKPGLRQVLDTVGWRGEVWLTETGYRAAPWDDAGEQDKQLRSVQGILRAQLEAPWWTATFFYEMSDCGVPIPDCDIDGYGLMRRTAAPDGTWQDNFILKPAFTWLRGELADNPIWGAPPDPDPPPPPVERPRLEAPHRGAGLPDGDLADWDDRGCVPLTRWERLAADRQGAEDLSARVCAAWSDAALWLAVEAVDDRHHNESGDEQLWFGDSVQLGLDPAADAAAGQPYDEDDGEWTLAFARGESRLAVEHGEVGAVGRVRVEGRRARYELRVPLPDLRAGRTLRASFLLNDNDGGEREGWLEWTAGMGRGKEPALFGDVVLAAEEAVPTPDAGVAPEADAGHRPPPPLPEVDDAGAGSEAGLDAAPPGPRDGTVLPPPDPRPDADFNANRPGDLGPQAESGGEEGCRAAPGARGWGWALLLGLIAVRRRARRGC